CGTMVLLLCPRLLPMGWHSIWTPPGQEDVKDADNPAQRSSSRSQQPLEVRRRERQRGCVRSLEKEQVPGAIRKRDLRHFEQPRALVRRSRSDAARFLKDCDSACSIVTYRRGR